MRKSLCISVILALLILTTMAGVVQAFETPESIVSASKVYVSKVVYDPGTFFTGDSGTVTIYVTNANSNQSVVVNHVSYGDENIKLTSRPYDSTTNIGPLQAQPFVFSVETSAKEGTYYPTFTLNFRDADSLYYRAVVKVDNTPLELTIVDKPDAYSAGKKKTVYVQVANPRDDTVNNVILEVTGPGISTTPSKTFIGDVAPGAKIPLNFTISSEQPTTATLTLKYDNGDDTHTVQMDLPVTFGLDKKQANPVISNVQVKPDVGFYRVTGDVTNAGLENANSVTVTSLSPAVPQDPYRSYVVGILKPDDFGSFEVTFTAANATSVPLQMSYKDADGNIYTSIQDVKISGVSLSSAQKNDLPLLPIAAAVIIIGAFVGGWYFYLRKKK
ncbi:hypothetical protein [uncultured Methanoregula sp.]|uniref:hypothetical protein n=1 Tax=uncultured Methanoregula sp. TaxID=1005933 RepID=UPI002AAC151A|nr:hypothetical protein [uncultured Methanoregula sp.]